MQTKLGSIAEAWANIAVGFIVNFFCNWIFLPLLGVPMLSAKQNFLFGCIMTVISLCRSYVLRRWFNGLRFGNKT
jgi:ACR3 family arsenite efflux pump ArsB